MIMARRSRHALEARGRRVDTVSSSPGSVEVAGMLAVEEDVRAARSWCKETRQV